MFGGGAKPSFGQTSTGTGFAFTNTATSSPFSQSFGKPATGAFGQAASFGQQNTSLFSNNQPSGGLFGSGAASSFGAAPTTQSTFGGFSQPAQNTSLFGAAPQNANQTALFGQPATPAFGTTKSSGFGFGQTQPSTSLFGQSTAASTSGSGFGAFGQTTTTNVFGSSGIGFGQANNTATGTAVVKYQASIGTDTLVKNGQPNNVNTRQHCITAMKEYEGKSLEELRMEDYLANRKGPQAGAAAPFGQAQPGTSGGLFGSNAAQQTAGLFQQNDNKSLFGASNTLGGTGFGSTTTPFGATSQGAPSIFSKPFSTPATSSASFAFGSTNNTNNLFGVKNYGQTGSTGMFGTSTQSATPVFGQTQTGFSGFGNTNQQPSLFGNAPTDNKAAFGITSTANTGFGAFGANTNTSTAGSTLFGSKPATGFGTNTAFGTSTSAGFGTFGSNTTSGSLFNNPLNKPATSGFGGFGTQTSTAPLGGGLNFGSGNQSLFGNNAAKPGLFGNATQPSTGLFGNTPGFSSNTLGGFGSNTLGGTLLGNTQQTSSVPIHQQIMAIATSPYGDNPIFKDLKFKKGDETDSLKPTNPAAQKAILDSTSKQFKISTKPINPAVKVKPVGNILTKKSLFEGLEEYDNTLENSFSLKPNAKRLIIKPKQNSISKVSNADNNNSFPSKDPKSLFDRDESNNSSNNESKENRAKNDNIIKLAKPQNNESSRRESWLHPNALGKIRQENIESESIMENTLSELVPRKSAERVEQISKSNDSITERQIAGEAFSKLNDSPSKANLSESYTEDKSIILLKDAEPHPTGIVLRRIGYYTIPSMDELTSYLSEDMTSCVVPNFTIGREGYGNVYFSKPVDVFGLNLDEIVHFRHKEVIIYPDDDNKPQVGNGLNKEAQITLDQVWPHDKTLHEPIKDSERLAAMDYEGKLRRVCDKHDIRFIEYRPETGSWVFRVKHFSKYGLNDSDEEDNVPTDPKKLKISTGAAEQKLNNKQVDAKGGKSNAGTSHLMDNGTNEILSGDHQVILQNEFREKFLNSNFKSDTSATSSAETLARGIGADSHKLQLMKASFFVEDDLDMRSVSSETFKGRDSPDQIVPNKHSVKSFGLSSNARSLSNDSIEELDIETNETQIHPMQITYSESDALQEAAQLKLAPLILKPNVAKIKVINLTIPFEKSIGAKLKGKCVSDVALFNCRRFKLKFSPCNTLLIPSKPNIDKGGCGDGSLNLFGNWKGSVIHDLKKIKVDAGFPYEPFEKTTVQHLEIQLSHSLRVDVEDSDCPFIQCEGREDLLFEHFEEAKKIEHLGEIEKYAVSVWSLCHSLWGSRDELEGLDPSSHFSVICRKNLFSEWLENLLSGEKTLNKEVSKSGYLDHILELLLCHKVTEACELAFKYDDANLSLLISQLSGGPAVRQLIQHQLSIWQKIEADKFIHPERLKLFMLIAGVPVICSSHGPINVLTGINWLKALALQLWYLCSPSASITDALMAYESAFNSSEFYAMPPTPAHKEKYEMKSNQPIYDMRYHILQLYSKKGYPMESLLNPATYTPDPLDYRLSWLLLQTLESLGYRHCSVYSESQLHVCFAEQLETQELWQWSIFILLHIKDKNRRELAVQEILYRYVTLSTTNSEEEKFVVNSLGVPQKWIDWAKAVRAGVEKDFHLQAKFLLRANQWSEAHQIIMEHIAPDAIINDNIEYLKELLSQFEDQKSKKIMRVPNWANQGQTLLDFMEINEKFERLKGLHLSDIETRWENLKRQLADLCSRINLLPCPTAKHRLCQSEIAQRLACLLRGIMLACQISNPCLLIKIALEKLPLPQEFAQQELRVLLDAFVNDQFNFSIDGRANN